MATLVALSPSLPPPQHVWQKNRSVRHCNSPFFGACFLILGQDRNNMNLKPVWNQLLEMKRIHTNASKERSDERIFLNSLSGGRKTFKRQAKEEESQKQRPSMAKKLQNSKISTGTTCQDAHLHQIFFACVWRADNLLHGWCSHCWLNCSSVWGASAWIAVRTFWKYTMPLMFFWFGGSFQVYETDPKASNLGDLGGMYAPYKYLTNKPYSTILYCCLFLSFGALTRLHLNGTTGSKAFHADICSLCTSAVLKQSDLSLVGFNADKHPDLITLITWANVSKQTTKTNIFWFVLLQLKKNHIWLLLKDLIWKDNITIEPLKVRKTPISQLMTPIKHENLTNPPAQEQKRLK